MNKADPTRSPAGTETVWAYTHVPLQVRGDAGGDLTGKWDAAEVEAFADRVEAEIEEHAPGFRALVTGRHVLSPPALEAGNANLAGGALGGGTTALSQQAVFRPIPGLGRAETPVRGLLPGVGVGPPRRWRPRRLRLQRRPRRARRRPHPHASPAAAPKVAICSRLKRVATFWRVRSRRGLAARGGRRPGRRDRRRRPARRRARGRGSDRRRRRARPARRRRAPRAAPVASVSVSTASVERVLRLVEVVAERGARLGLPAVGARQRGDAVAQAVESEAVVEQELDAGDRRGRRGRARARGRRPGARPARRRSPRPGARGRARPRRRRSGRSVASAASADRPHQRGRAATAVDRVHAGAEALDGRTERERLGVAHQPARRALDQPTHEEEHLVLHRRGDDEIEGVDRGPGVGGVEHVARDDVARARAPAATVRSRRTAVRGS